MNKFSSEILSKLNAPAQKVTKDTTSSSGATFMNSNASEQNTFMNALDDANNFKCTENGAVAHKTTKSNVYDLFAFGSAYRNRTDDERISLFKAAYDENPTLALKCLFYIRDVLDGTGERKFFRVCFNWLAKKHTDIARANMKYITYKGIGRWDDFYCLLDTPLEAEMLTYLKDVTNAAISEINGGAVAEDDTNRLLIFKWLKSENTSSVESKAIAKKIREAFEMSSKEYRKMLSIGRRYTRVVERLMSDKDWNDIEFAKLPSKAGLKYRFAFKRHPETAERYKAFAADDTTTVNTKTLFPAELVSQARRAYRFNQTDRDMLNKMWTQLPDVFAGKASNMICVCDTSGSMCGWLDNTGVQAIDIAVSLGMYCAERLQGPFHNKFITFSSKPSLINAGKGVDFVDKVQTMYNNPYWEGNTDLEAVFKMLLKIADRPDVKEEDIPDTLCIISDMEIDNGAYIQPEEAETQMEAIRRVWQEHGHKMPRLIYWNADARHDTILDAGPYVSLVSGSSQNTFKAILTGKNGYDLMLEAIMNPKYEGIHA